MKRPPVQIRHSSLVTLLGTIDPHLPEAGRSGGCAAAYQDEYIRGHEADPGEAANDGICFHAAVAIYGRWLTKNSYSGKMPHHKRRFMNILESEIRRNKIPEYRQEGLRELGMFFTDSWKYDKDAEHIFEQRWFFTLNWQQIETIPKRAPTPMWTPLEDWIGSTLDHLFYKPTPREITFVDFKTGDSARGLDYGEDAKHNEQLQMYSAAVLARFPECERVTARIWGLKGGAYNISEYDYTRETVYEPVNDRISAGRKKLDEHWAEFGTLDWPATGDHAAACRHCSIRGGCPLTRGMFDMEVVVGL